VAAEIAPEIAVVDGAGRVDYRGAGAAAPPDVPWWSFTKSLIAAAFLRLAEDYRLDLDRPLEPHAFTARQLLSHRSGLGDYGGLAAYRDAVAADLEPWPDEVLLRRVPLDRLLFVP